MILNNVDELYVCHCKSLTDRVDFIMNQLKNFNLKSTWVTSFDRDDIQKEDLDSLLPLFDSEFDFMGNRRKLRIPEISIMLKHLVVWSDMIDRDIKTALILEDDVILCDNFVDKFNEQIKELSPTFDFVWVGSCCDMNIPFNGEHLIRNNQSRCAHGYLLNHKTAKILIQNLRYNNFPVDIFFNLVINKFNLESYWMEPDLIRQSKQFETSIQNKF